MDPLELATQTGEIVSILLIFVAMLVFILAASKSRTARSLQFQMLVFAIVLFAAEIPRILGTLGVIDVAPYEDLGLEIHSVSMVILVGFMAYRIYGFMRER